MEGKSLMLWEALGSIALACMAAGFLTGLLFERSRMEREEFEAQIAEYDSRWEEAHPKSPRHAKSQPRASSSPASAAVTPEPRTSLVRSGYRDSWFPPGLASYAAAYAAAAGAINGYLTKPKDAVTARDIETVLLPPAPAPDKTGADGTGRLVKLTDTGDLVKLTDSWIAEHIRPEVIA
jgi:hypothetical protein